MGKKEKKQTTVPKTRKQRAKMRTRKESFAGHFADRLAANIKQRNDIFAFVKDVPGIAGVEDISAVDACAVLNRLADEGFAPAKKRSGRTAVTFTPGMQVVCAPECVQMLQTQFPADDYATAKFFIGDSYAPTGDKKKDTQIPLRKGSSKLTEGTPLGFVSRKWVSPAAA